MSDDTNLVEATVGMGCIALVVLLGFAGAIGVVGLIWAELLGLR